MDEKEVYAERREFYSDSKLEITTAVREHIKGSQRAYEVDKVHGVAPALGGVRTVEWL
jgi:hypothetical protein